MRRKCPWDLLIVGVMFLSSLALMSGLPGRVPVHFGLTGTADTYASKAFALFIVPCLSLVVIGLVRLAPRWSPKPLPADNFEFMGRILAGFLLFVHGTILYVGITGTGQLPRAFFVGMSVFFIVMAEMLPGFGPNYLVGIRTPWTLRNEETWRRTHLAARKIMLGGGIASLICSLLNWIPGVFIFILIPALATLPVSYVIHRRVLAEGGGRDADEDRSNSSRMAIALGYVGVILVAFFLLIVGGVSLLMVKAKASIWPTGEAVVKALDQGEYETVASLFTPELRKVMNAKDLSIIYPQISKDLGRFKAIRWGGVFLITQFSPLTLAVQWEADYDKEKAVKVTMGFDPGQGAYKISGLFFNCKRTREQPLVTRLTLCRDVKDNQPVDIVDAFSLADRRWFLLTEWQNLRPEARVEISWTEPGGTVIGPWKYPVPKDAQGITKTIWTSIDLTQFNVPIQPAPWTLLILADGQEILKSPIQVLGGAPSVMVPPGAPPGAP